MDEETGPVEEFMERLGKEAVVMGAYDGTCPGRFSFPAGDLYLMLNRWADAVAQDVYAGPMGALLLPLVLDRYEALKQDPVCAYLAGVLLLHFAGAGASDAYQGRFFPWVARIVDAAVSMLTLRVGVPTVAVGIQLLTALLRLKTPEVTEAVGTHPACPAGVLLRTVGVIRDVDTQVRICLLLCRMLVHAPARGLSLDLELQMVAQVVVTCKTHLSSAGRVLTKLLPYIEKASEEALAALRDRIGLHRWVVEVLADPRCPTDLTRDMLEVVGTLVRSPKCAAVLVSPTACGLLPVLARVLPQAKTQPVLVPVLTWVLGGLYWTPSLAVLESIAQHLEFFEFTINVLSGSIPGSCPSSTTQARLTAAWSCIRVVSKDVPSFMHSLFRETHGADAILYMLATPAFDVLDNGEVTEHALLQLQDIIEANPKRGGQMVAEGQDRVTLVRIATSTAPFPTPSAKACARALCLTYFPHHGVS
jgi:hypothetical protein